MNNEIFDQLMSSANLDEMRTIVLAADFKFSELTLEQCKSLSIQFLSGGKCARELFPIEGVMIGLMGDDNYDEWADQNDVS